MSYLHSILLAKPSLHLNALRASGLDLSRLFESASSSHGWLQAETELSESSHHNAASNKDALSPLNRRERDELCLNDE